MKRFITLIFLLISGVAISQTLPPAGRDTVATGATAITPQFRTVTNQYGRWLYAINPLSGKTDALPTWKQVRGNFVPLFGNIIRTGDFTNAGQLIIDGISPILLDPSTGNIVSNNIYSNFGYIQRLILPGTRALASDRMIINGDQPQAIVYSTPTSATVDFRFDPTTRQFFKFDGTDNSSYQFLTNQDGVAKLNVFNTFTQPNIFNQNLGLKFGASLAFRNPTDDAVVGMKLVNVSAGNQTLYVPGNRTDTLVTKSDLTGVYIKTTGDQTHTGSLTNIGSVTSTNNSGSSSVITPTSIGVATSSAGSFLSNIGLQFNDNLGRPLLQINTAENGPVNYIHGVNPILVTTPIGSAIRPSSTSDFVNKRYADSLNAAGSAAFVPTSRQINTGYGLTGGGDLTANRTHVVDTTVIVSKPNLASQMALKHPLENQRLSTTNSPTFNTLNVTGSPTTPTAGVNIGATGTILSWVNSNARLTKLESPYPNSTRQYRLPYLNTSTTASTLADSSQVVSSVSRKADTASVNSKSGIQNQYSTVEGTKRIYSKTPYTTVGNYVSNSDFSGGMTGYTATNLTDAGSAALYSIVNHDGKNWLRINESTANNNGLQGSVSVTVTVPPESRNSLFEVSFLTSGMLTGFQLANEDSKSFLIKIDPATPERIYYYFNPNGASTFNLRFYRSESFLASGNYADFSEILVKEATYSMAGISSGLPSSGGSIQIARWMSSWNEPQQEALIANYRKMGGLVRVWLSSDLFASYATKTAVKRTTVSSSNFSTAYNALTTAKYPTGLDPAKTYYLDWFFNKCRQYGLKTIIVLGTGFPDGNGNPSSTMSTPSTYEFLDNDSQVQSGFTTLFNAVVSRYKSNENIVAWELNNEGWNTWRINFAGLNQSTSNLDRGYTFAGYKAWERTAYSAIKANDPYRPIVLNENNSLVGQYLASDDISDWYAPSFYPGTLAVDATNGISSSVITPYDGFGQILGSFKNGYSFIAHAVAPVTLPTGLTEGQTYYVVNLTANTFQVSATLGGSPITLSGGSGIFVFYATDGEVGISTQDYVLQKLSYTPKFKYISEGYGAIGLNSELRLYQNPTVNASYINAMAKRLQKYGIASMLAYDEGNLYVNPTTGVFNEAGRALIGVSTSTYAADAVTQTPPTEDIKITGYVKAAGVNLSATTGSSVAASAPYGFYLAPDIGTPTQSTRLSFGSLNLTRNSSGVLGLRNGATFGSTSGTGRMSFGTGIRIGDETAATSGTGIDNLLPTRLVQMDAGTTIDSAMFHNNTTKRVSAKAIVAGTGITLTPTTSSLTISTANDLTIPNRLSKTAAYTVTIADFGTSSILHLYVSASAGAVPITLPSAATFGASNKTYQLFVYKTDSSANAVTLSGSVNINGASTYTLGSQFNSVLITSDTSLYYAR